MYRFAIIGCGDSAQKHASALQNLGKLVAVCDVDAGRAQKLASEYQANAYDLADVLLEKEKDVDIVIVSSPTGYHAEHTIKSLQAGKDVICERPFCITNAAAWQIFETARLCRRKLWIISPAKAMLLKNPDLDGFKVIQFKMSCTIGRQDDLSSWKTSAFPGGNPLLVHLADPMELISRLFGAIRHCATVLKANADKAFELAGSLVMETVSGTMGTINWIETNASESQYELIISDRTKTVTITDKEFTVQEIEAISRFYKDLLDQLNKSVRTAAPADFSVIRNIEKIYLSLPSQTEDSF